MDDFEKFCPLIKATCRKDCVFRCNKTAAEHDITICLIASKLDAINGFQHDDLVDISNKLG